MPPARPVVGGFRRSRCSTSLEAQVDDLESDAPAGRGELRAGAPACARGPHDAAARPCRSQAPRSGRRRPRSPEPANRLCRLAAGGWEPDFWGRIRRTSEAERGGGAGQRRGPGLDAALAAGVAGPGLRRAAHARRTGGGCWNNAVEAYRRTLTISQNRYNAGVAARSDVVSAQAQLDNARAQSSMSACSGPRWNTPSPCWSARRRRRLGPGQTPGSGSPCRTSRCRSRRACWSAGPTSRRPSGRWRPPTRASASKSAAWFPVDHAVRLRRLRGLAAPRSC